MYRYTGECPGFSKGIVKASFTSTAFPPSPGHDRLYLIVRQGENDFDYKIKEKNTIVDEGTFTAYVETTTIVEERNKEPRTKYVCPGNRLICESKEMYEVTVYECPSYPNVRR
jgi:hypothetical protein